MTNRPEDRGLADPDVKVIEADAMSAQIREVDSAQLLQGEKSIAIRHGGELYRLLVTRHNRLILQK